MPLVHGEVREGVSPSESPAGITKISQNTGVGLWGRTEEQTKSASKGAMHTSCGTASGQGHCLDSGMLAEYGATPAA